MTSSAEQMRSYKGPALFSFGFRPFFLGGSLVAAIIPLVMALAFGGVIDLNPAGGLIAWHGHEMIYGFIGAIAAGFILTAVPNWTGRLPLMGTPLALLAGLWIAGRIAMFFSSALGGMMTGLIDGAFLFVLDMFLWREVLAGKNWRNAPICILIFLLAMGNAVWHVEMTTGVGGFFGLHFGIVVMALLLALIGGRVTPSFTRNWLVKSGREPINAPFAMLDKLSLGALALGAGLWLFRPDYPFTGVALLVAGALHFARLMRWRGWRCIAEPLVLILHIGYFWLALSLVLLGASVLLPALLPSTAALHGLTAGAMGVMILAVMTRATLGHTGRALGADAPTIAIYALVNLGAAARVAAQFMPLPYTTMIAVSSVIWSSAFLLFAVVYGRYLLTPRGA